MSETIYGKHIITEPVDDRLVMAEALGEVDIDAVEPWLKKKRGIIEAP